MITIMWMQAGSHGGGPLQFEKAACREYHVLYVFMSNNIMSLCPTKYVFLSKTTYVFISFSLLSFSRWRMAKNVRSIITVKKAKKTSMSSMSMPSGATPAHISRAS